MRNLWGHLGGLSKAQTFKVCGNHPEFVSAGGNPYVVKRHNRHTIATDNP
jgi:hypothetical protein